VPVTKLRIRIRGDDSVSYIVEGMTGIREQRSIDQKLTIRLGVEGKEVNRLLARRLPDDREVVGSRPTSMG
jgi:hypothetical protein